MLPLSDFQVMWRLVEPAGAPAEQSTVDGLIVYCVIRTLFPFGFCGALPPPEFPVGAGPLSRVHR